MTEMPDEMRVGHVVVIGLVNYTHHLLVGGLQALRDGMAPFGLCVPGR
jgi:hypothetical protein